jgi:hypothetical protein
MFSSSNISIDISQKQSFWPSSRLIFIYLLASIIKYISLEKNGIRRRLLPPVPSSFLAPQLANQQNQVSILWKEKTRGKIMDGAKWSWQEKESFTWLRTWQEIKDLHVGCGAEETCGFTFGTFFKLVVLLALLEIKENKSLMWWWCCLEICSCLQMHVAVRTRDLIPSLSWPFLWSLRHSVDSIFLPHQSCYLLWLKKLQPTREPFPPPPPFNYSTSFFSNYSTFEAYMHHDWIIHLSTCFYLVDEW